MDTKILKQLIDVGLSEKESQVYLASLSAEPRTASDISRSAGLNRVTTYGILLDLEREGLVQKMEKNETAHFLAVSPDLLLQRAKQNVKNLEHALPDLKALIHGHQYSVSRRFFEGLEAVKDAYKETLSAKSEILNYANSKNIRDHWPEYDIEYVQKRMERRVFLRGIYPKDEYGKKVQNEDKKYFRKTRLLPLQKFWLENEIKIFDDKFFIASFAPQPFAIFIQSQTVADSQKQIFEIMWGMAEK